MSSLTTKLRILIKEVPIETAIELSSQYGQWVKITQAFSEKASLEWNGETNYSPEEVLQTLKRLTL